MKKSKLSLKHFYSLNTLFFCAFISVSIQLFLFSIEIAPDTPSYISAWKEHYGILDYTRTPVYPIFIGLISILFKGNLLYWGVVLSQFVLFLLSIKWFYNLSQTILLNPKISFFVSFIYAVHPCISSWSCAILTESLSISMMVGFLYFFYNAINYNNNKFVVMSNALVFLLVFLRPAFIFLLPTIFVFYIMLSFLKSKRFILGIVSTSVLFGLLFIYMNAFNDKYGSFTLSRIGAANQYYSARQFGYLKVNSNSSSEFNTFLKESIIRYGEFYNKMDSLAIEAHYASFLFSPSEINKAIIETSKEYPDRVFVSVCRRMKLAASSPLFECVNMRLSYLAVVVGPSIGTLLLCTVIFLFYCFQQVLKKDKMCSVPFFSFLIVVIIMGNFVVSSVGSYQSFGRLFISSVPCALILLTQLYLRISGLFQLK